MFSSYSMHVEPHTYLKDRQVFTVILTVFIFVLMANLPTFVSVHLATASQWELFFVSSPGPRAYILIDKFIIMFYFYLLQVNC